MASEDEHARAVSLHALWPTAVVAGALGVGALVMRLPYLNQVVRYDEALTFLVYGSQPVGETISTYTTPNNHVFHSVLMHLPYVVFGDALWAIRLPALIAGVLLVPVMYLVGRALYDSRVGVLAGVLVATSSVLIGYSTNARGYTMVALFTMLLILTAAHLLRGGAVWLWVAFAVVAALGFFTIPLMLYPFGIVVTWMLLETPAERKREWVLRVTGAAVASIVLTAILYLPIVIRDGATAVVNNDTVQSLTWSEFAAQLPSAVAESWRLWVRNLPVVLVAVLLLAFVVGVVDHRRIGRTRVPLLAPVVLFLVPVMAVQRVVGFGRTWLFLLPLFLLMASAGVISIIDRAPIHVQFPAFVGVAVVLSVWLSVAAIGDTTITSSLEGGTLPSGEAVAAYLDDIAEPGDMLLVEIPSDGPLWYYFGKWETPLPLNTFSSLRPDGRLMLVVNLAWDQSLETVLAYKDIDPANYDTVLIRSFEGADVYELTAVDG